MVDDLKTEQAAADALLEKGIVFELPGRKKVRKYRLREPTLGTLDMLSTVYLKMEWNNKGMEDDPLQESKLSVKKNAMLAAKAMAIMVLSNRWKIRLFSGLCARFFYNRLTPSTLLQVAGVILQLSNYGDFTNSIRLMSAQRTTAPKADLVEQPA